MFASHQLPVVVLDDHLNVRSLNDAAEKLFGWRAEDVVGRPYNLVPEHETRAHEELIERLWQEKGPLNLLAQRLHKNGTLIDVRISATRLPEGDNNSGGILCLFDDLSCSSDRDLSFRQSYLQYKALVDASPHGIQLSDLDGVITFSNPAHHRILGYPEGDLVGRKIWEMNLTEESKEETRRYVDSLVLNQPPPTPFLTKNRTKDGREVDLQVDWDYTYDETGMLTGFLSIITDVTERSNIQESLRESEKKFRSVFEQAGAGMYLLSRNGILLDVNPSFCTLTGYTREKLIDSPVWRLIHPEDAADVEEVFCQIRAGIKTNSNAEIRYVRRDGRVVWVKANSTWVADSRGELLYGVVMAYDITASKEANRAAKDERAFLQTVIDAIDDPIMVTDLSCKLLKKNRAAEEVVIKERKAAKAFPCCHLLSGEKRPCSSANIACPAKEVRRTGRPSMSLFRSPQEKGQVATYEVHASPLLGANGEMTGVVQSVREISDRIAMQDALKQKEADLNSLRFRDPLTGLPNREYIWNFLDSTLPRCQESEEKVALLLLCLDRFKNINDSLGHRAGDQVLVEVANRLQHWIKKSDVIARFGGNEFAIVVRKFEDLESLGSLIRKLQAVLSAPFTIDGHEFSLSTSVGVSTCPLDTQSAAALFRYADAAANKVRQEGGNGLCFFTPDLETRSIRRFFLEENLRKALAYDQFVLHFQPQINLATGEVEAMEALVRWEHPELGLVPPGDFIPLAEETGLIVPIGEWVLRTACAYNRELQDMGFLPMRMAVNISAKQFRDPGFIGMVESALADTELAHRWLEIELTESVIIEDVKSAVEIMDTLRKKGISISIDDFGTGYSSLGYLQTFPITSLKIDRSFVKDLELGPQQRTITKTIILLARGLGLEVVAEGVESEEQSDFLKAEGCNRMQGFFFSRPVSGEAVVHFLNQHYPSITARKPLPEQLKECGAVSG